jgi:hypothetical protein
LSTGPGIAPTRSGTRRIRTTMNQAARLGMARGRERWRKPPSVFGLHLRGRADASLLQESLSWVARRHSALRMYFPPGPDLEFGLCLPADQVSWRLTEVDLRDVPADDRDRRRDQAVERAITPFTSEEPPLYRASLLRLADDEAILVVTVDHVVFDGTSLRVFLADLETVYGHLAGGRDPRHLAVEMSDCARFTEAEHEWLHGPAAEDALRFWARTWRDGFGPYPVVDLPGPAGGEADPTGFWQRELPAEEVRAARGSFGRAHVSEFVLLTGAVLTALTEHTGRTEHGVLHPSSRRFTEGAGSLIGYLANRTLLRVPTPPGAGLDGIVAGTRQAVYAAAEHSMMPFELLMQRFAPDAVGRRPPGAYVHVNTETPAPAPTLPGLVTTLWWTPPAGAFRGIPWLNVNLESRPGGVELACGYDPAQISCGFVGEFMDRVATLVRGGR